MNEQLLIYIDGWWQSSISVMKVDTSSSGVIVECSHSLWAPEQSLIEATGGILMLGPGLGDKGELEPLVVICGGRFVLDVSSSSDANVHNQLCMILNENGPPSVSIRREQSVYHLSVRGLLNFQRIGSASLAIDNGQTLWVTGGLNDGSYGSGHLISELVGLNNNSATSSHQEFTTNGQGPFMPTYAVMHHCLEKIEPEMAILAGGKSSGMLM